MKNFQGNISQFSQFVFVIEFPQSLITSVSALPALKSIQLTLDVRARQELPTTTATTATATTQNTTVTSTAVLVKNFNSSYISDVSSLFNESILVKSTENDDLTEDGKKQERAVTMASFLTIVAVVPGFIVIYLLCLSCPKILDSALNKAV